MVHEQVLKGNFLLTYIVFDVPLLLTTHLLLFLLLNLNEEETKRFKLCQYTAAEEIHE